MFMIDDEAEEDYHWQCHCAWLKICNFLYMQKEIYLCIVLFCKSNKNFPFHRERLKPNPSSSYVYHVYWP